MRTLVLAVGFLGWLGPSVSDQRGATTSPVELVMAIRRADYEGNRSELRRLWDELKPFVGGGAASSRVRYWRAFALWRRAINGFNERAPAVELHDDLEAASTEFAAAWVDDPTFWDAKIGALSCLHNLIFLHRAEPDQLRVWLSRAAPLQRELQAVAAENPRFLWVRGANEWHNPPERGGGHETAIRTYLKGLELAQQRPASPDPLEPSWGEAELLMNLAFAHLHQRAPDLKRAEAYALAALKLVPSWHYVRDLLLPQIRKHGPEFLERPIGP